MSVRTAWEIAALEDVRLAPSPRQQRPAPGPVRAASLLLTLPGPPAKDPGAAGRGGPHPQPGPCSPALGCSNSAALPAPHFWDIGGQGLGLSPSFHVSIPSLGNLGKSWAFVPQQLQGWQPPPLPQPQEAQETLRKRAEPSLPPGPGLPQSPAGGSVGGRAQATLQPVRAMLSEQLSAETCCSVRPETCCAERAGPQGPQTSGRKAMGAHRRGLAPGMSSHPVSPPTAQRASPPPSPTSPVNASERPRANRLLAIPGRFPGLRQQGTGGQRGGPCWRPLAWVVSSQAESLIYLVQKL